MGKLVLFLFLISSGALADEGVRTPLKFSDTENVIPRKSYQFIYEIEKGRDPAVFVGPWRLSSSEGVFLKYGARDQMDANYPRRDHSLIESTVLYIGWRREFIEPQKILFKDDKGKILYEMGVKEKKLKQWRDEQESVRQELLAKGANEGQLNQSVLLRNGLVLDPALTGTVLKNSKFQACLNTESARSKAELCTPFYQVENLQLRAQEPGAGMTLEIGDAKVADRGGVPVRGGQDFKFKFHLDNGLHYEFQTVVPGFDWEDFSAQTEGAEKRYSLKGEGAPPANLKYELEPQNKKPTFWDSIGWQETIGDFRRPWSARTSKNEMELFIKGPIAGVYQLILDLSRIPPESDRLFIEGPSRKSTYLGYYEETLLVPDSALQVQSSELEIRDLNPANKNKKIWKLGLPYQGEMNQSHVNIRTREGIYKLYKETYRAYPGEFSLRLSTMGSGGSLATLGELYTSYWFEDFIYKSPATYQHFGVSGRYTTSLTKLKAKDGENEVSLSSMNVFLKYRFQPGVWERDEATGAYLTAQNFNLGQISDTNLGTGVFWARSMPKAFDDAMNVIPVFRYPKWVDMDFILYPVNMNSEIQSELSWEINFHGKLLWTKSFWGEMGFGARSYNLKKSSEDLEVHFTPVYGTLGLGLNF